MASAVIDREVDLIEEFRLRRWARENYVPAHDRSQTWHPIVLDEMRRKDAEANQSTVLAS